MKLRIALVMVTLMAGFLTFARLRLSPDLSALFPDRGEAAGLARFTHAFGGGDFGALLVRGDSEGEVEEAARAVIEALRSKSSVVRVVDRAPPLRLGGDVDPTRAWAFAGPAARATLAASLTPAGMRARLEGTRELLLAPGSSDVEDWLARDPLRLSAIPFEGTRELAAGVSAGSGEHDAFVADEGRARLVVIQPRGSAFQTGAAAAFVGDLDDAIAVARAAHPSITMELAGGHAVARATERMMVRDLVVSGTLSIVLAAAVFVATFRRARALVAVLPPLALGTLWTTGLAALWPGGLSAIAIAFGAVVIGVGVDTGVHVYAALLDGRARGLAPEDAARFARKESWRPTMTAAAIAGLAFASLALSDLAALAQLGVLCGIGEVATSIAILLVTPEIGAWLERGALPRPLSDMGWPGFFIRITRTRARAAWTLAVALVPVAALLVFGWPRAGDALVALRPSALAPLKTQDAIYRLFGGRAGQWVVLDIDRDAERAATRADDVAEALEPLATNRDVDGFDALATFLPSATTQARRLAVRDALDLPSRRADLEAALTDAGFDLAMCAPALEAFAHPSQEIAKAGGEASDGALAWMTARHLAADGADTIAATYVRPAGDASRDARALAAIRAGDPQAIVTGYAHLEVALKENLARDLPRVGVFSLLIATVALFVAFRSARDAGIALATVVLELAAVGVAMRVLHVRWHVYDALVVPVLIGITLDESMFLLHAARKGGADAIEAALRAQGPLVACTALTTTAGFAALLACRFDGLFDLGAVGSLGAIFGLVAALVIVPAGLRLLPRRAR